MDITTYEALLAFHILFAVIWIGSDFHIQVLTSRARRAGEDEKVAWLASEIAWYGTRVLVPSSLLLVILGFGLLHESNGAYDLGQFWVAFGFGVWLFSFIAGAGYLGPESGRLGALVEERGPSDPEYKRRLARIFFVSRIELVLLILAVLDMVVKPWL